MCLRSDLVLTLFERFPKISEISSKCQEYASFTFTSGNALCNQKLADGVNITVPKYKSDPTLRREVPEISCNTTVEVNSSKVRHTTVSMRGWAFSNDVLLASV